MCLSTLVHAVLANTPPLPCMTTREESYVKEWEMAVLRAWRGVLLANIAICAVGVRDFDDWYRSSRMARTHQRQSCISLLIS